MGFYLLANFFSALSNTLAKYLTHNGFFPSGTRVLDIFLHANLINLLLFFAIYFFKKRRNEIHFSIKETFFRKDEFKQVLLFAIPILAASYKLFMMDFMKISDIEISAMIKPFCVWFLAIIFLGERFYPFYIKYALIAVLGFLIANKNILPFDIFPYTVDFDNGKILYSGYQHSNAHYDSKTLFFLVSYICFASIGAVTRRYYCRKCVETMQAVCVEFVMFAFYGLIILTIRGTFSINLLFHPCSLLISLITLSHHFCIIHGVQKAPTVTALEFINFSKIVFVLILSYCLLGTKIYNNKILGALIIAITLILFNFRIRKESNNIKKNNFK